VSVPPRRTCGHLLRGSRESCGWERCRASAPKFFGTCLRHFAPTGPASRSCYGSPGDGAELIRAVESGDTDVTFFDIGPYDTGLLKVRPLLDDPMVFLAPAGSLEAGWRVVSLADIAHLPMIGTRDPGCRQIIDDAFRQAPIPPTYVFRSENNPTIHGLVGSGLAYAVISLLAALRPRRLGIAWHRERRQPPPLMPFVDAAADVCRDLGDRWAEAHGMSCAMESSNSSDRG
jgi:DNA-binding transcriptional LysR family regulator